MPVPNNKYVKNLIFHSKKRNSIEKPKIIDYSLVKSLSEFAIFYKKIPSTPFLQTIQYPNSGKDMYTKGLNHLHKIQTNRAKKIQEKEDEFTLNYPFSPNVTKNDINSPKNSSKTLKNY